jgi:hypothetical protein
MSSVTKINAAVAQCLTRCYASQAPVLCLTEYLDSLLQSGWSRQEVAAVRSAAVRILRNIAAPEEDDGLPIGFSLTFLS